MEANKIEDFQRSCIQRCSASASKHELRRSRIRDSEVGAEDNDDGNDDDDDGKSWYLEFMKPHQNKQNLLHDISEERIYSRLLLAACWIQK